ncbi:MULTISPECIES: hypothetical protein [unclassified Flavobacterium]|jgi:hypothetical protein|uniref:hypothetical protein n=1 Tax=unclassified Flavobacterium TaxID=196869 RepID=UPI0012A9AECA|nr:MULTISPECIES: hypothetical protein [unclassified Flavobacterium]MBF4485384.1 hypothetical protein [Flavobacterium sp. CSZ]QGK74540.1 hypothetical protein GIY83_10905 [Flavobacterium sp. SLB02]
MPNIEFITGMKVSLGNEFGLVIVSQADQPDFCGIIRWDTINENDFEDWRGQFGTFIQLGGRILSEDYNFRFINYDGSKKYS